MFIHTPCGCNVIEWLLLFLEATRSNILGRYVFLWVCQFPLTWHSKGCKRFLLFPLFLLLLVLLFGQRPYRVTDGPRFCTPRGPLSHLWMCGEKRSVLTLPHHGDQALGHLSTGSWLGGVWLHGGGAFLWLRPLLCVWGLCDWGRGPHQPHILAAFKHPATTHTPMSAKDKMDKTHKYLHTGRVTSPAVFRRGPGYVVKLHLPAHALFV